MALFRQSRRVPSDPAGIASDPSEILAVLRTCCRAASPAMLISPDIGAVTAGRFCDVSADKVTFDLVSETGPPDMAAVIAQFKPFTTCTVGFSLGTRAGVFLSAVRDLAESGSDSILPQLTVEFPRTLTNLEARKTFRVPVYGNPALDFSIHYGTAPVRGDVHDISFGGILVEFPDPESLDIDVGDMVDSVLHYDSRSVIIKSEIRREERRKNQPVKYGFIFPDFYAGGEVNPPEEFRRIVKELETDWLKNGSQQPGY